MPLCRRGAALRGAVLVGVPALKLVVVDKMNVTDQPSSVGDTFVVPSPWQVNRDVVAEHVNVQAPGGAGNVKVAVVKNDKTAKVVAKGLGDGQVPDSSGGVPVVCP